MTRVSYYTILQTTMHVRFYIEIYLWVMVQTGHAHSPLLVIPSEEVGHIIHARRFANHAIHAASINLLSLQIIIYDYLYWRHQECAIDNNSITFLVSLLFN